VSRTSNLCGAGFSRTTLPFRRSNLGVEKRGLMLNLLPMNSKGVSERFLSVTGTGRNFNTPKKTFLDLRTWKIHHHQEVILCVLHVSQCVQCNTYGHHRGIKCRYSPSWISWCGIPILLETSFLSGLKLFSSHKIRNDLMPVVFLRWTSEDNVELMKDLL
jgi:hypothetical protein